MRRTSGCIAESAIESGKSYLKDGFAYKDTL